MKLPNAKNAYIPEGKILNYLLSETHPVGKSKAKFFRKLGFNETNTDQFEQSLLAIPLLNEVEDFKETVFGVNYVISDSFKSPGKKNVRIKTVWFVESKGTKPRFVTAIPDIIILGKKK